MCSFYLIAHVVLAGPLGAVGGWFLCPFDMSRPFARALPYCMMLQAAPGSSVFSLSQGESQPFRQGALVPFIGGRYLGTKMWALGVVATGVSVLLGLLRRQLGDKCLYTKSCI